ncbi:DcrB-related protein [Rosenbergiella australiborealis]|uniref:DcrB-related protein n=1 Tax=Rosenbergiella australiborealis TaxID=1544696 RepID=A0ABS5T6M9_9GAMM|nr:DcrB-related protein [Rosenbergiella australiborealis]MBT0728002.1 DcrB-related protein [Rosenbergiella australiborealis]
MDSQCSKYPFADGYFLTPVPLYNRSIHQLHFVDTQDNAYQIIINHGRLADNQNLQQFVEQEVEKMQRQVPGFSLEATLPTYRIGPAQCEVIQQTHKLLHEGCWFTQQCAFIHLPLHPQLNPYEKNSVVISLATPNEQPEQLAHYQHIINSFVPWE